MDYKKSYIMKQINDVGITISHVVVEEVSPYEWVAWFNWLTPIYEYIKPYKILISYEKGKFCSAISSLDIIYCNPLNKSSGYSPICKVFELKVLYRVNEKVNTESIVVRKIKEIYGL